LIFADVERLLTDNSK